MFYTKTGTQQFITDLGSPGNPGFFEPEGAQNFVFDPKCFYDHLAQRFVVISPEVYTSSQEAWIDIAVSDDTDPNGVWYRYRTNAVIESSPGVTHWWDYPGAGYDSQAYYVTSNLFGLSSGAGWGGVGYRIFNKTPMLTGQPVTFATLRDGASASVQVAQHFGTNIAPFFVSVNSSTSLKVQAITNPLTAPTLTQRTVTVPSHAGPGGPPTPGGTAVSVVDSRIFNVCWRNGMLYATHNIGVAGDRTLARWYQMNTGTWPTSGVITLVQSGDIDPGPGIHSFFPAIYANSNNDVGMVVGTSSATQNIAVAVTGRDATDPTGRMALPQIIKLGEFSGGGRWGDYYDIATDPTNDTTFWVIGEYRRTSSGWANWIASFTIGDFSQLQGYPDHAGNVIALTPVTIDVLSNDFSRNGSLLTIPTFQSTSQRGGTIARSVGTGPGGRDQLIYTPPAGVQATDSFTYTLSDGTNQQVVAVTAEVFNPALFRVSDSVLVTGAGLDARYYDLSAPTVLPDFTTLTPFLNTTVTTLNYVSTTGVFANSTRTDNVGALYTGFFLAPQTSLYTFYTNSDDGSALWIGNQRIVENDGTHGMIERAGTIGLQAGYHSIRIEFFEGGGGAGLIVSRQQYGFTKGVIPGANFVRGRACDDIDFNNDNSLFDPQDIDAFLSVYSEGPCIPANATCNDIDFNNDGSVFDPCDIDAFLLVFSEGPCTACGQ
ncbi:MAG: PA14 domain-containing protein [Phycisphaerales bacterium]